MKRVFLLLFCLAMSCGIQAQEADEMQEVYCMLVGHAKLFSKKYTITIDYGQSTPFWNTASKMQVVDEDGETIKFNSMIDASNWLASLGWTMLNAYAMDSKQGACYHWVFKKLVPKGEVVEFKTKGNTPKEKSKHGNWRQYE